MSSKGKFLSSSPPNTQRNVRGTRERGGAHAARRATSDLARSQECSEGCSSVRLRRSEIPPATLGLHLAVRKGQRPDRGDAHRLDLVAVQGALRYASAADGGRAGLRRQAAGGRDRARAGREHPRAAWPCSVVKGPPLAVPQHGSYASPGRTWWLWAARHSQQETSPLAAQPQPRMLEQAACKAVAFTAFDHPGLAGFEYCWVICYMHLNTGWRPLITPPRGPKKKQGVFATRAPHRPNHISLSALRVVSVDEAGG